MSVIRSGSEQKVVRRDPADDLEAIGVEFVDRFKDGPRMWTAIVMRELAHAPWRVIAEALEGCNGESTARDIYARGLRHLAKMLKA